MKEHTTLACAVRAVLLLAGVLGFCSARAMDVVPWLYDVRVAVADQSDEERQRAAAEGLQQVLVRVSGLAEVPVDGVLLQAVQAPERYLSRFAYQSEWLEGVRQSFIDLHFEPSGVQRLAREARLPIWSSRRPEVVVWIATRIDGEPLIVSDPQDPLRVALDVQAELRGLLVGTPEPLPPARLVAEGLSEPLLLHAQGQGADAVLAGRIDVGEGYARGTFEFRSLADADAGDRFDLRAETPDGLMQRAVGRVASVLAARYAVAGGEAGLVRLSVGGINDVSAYAACMRHLASLEYLTRTQVSSVSGDVVELVVETAADEARLMELLAADGRFEVTEGDEVGRVMDFERPGLRWRG